MGNLKITGMATGMDIESIVKDLVRAERVPLDKILQKKQTLEWKRDSYREMNLLLQTLRDDSLKMRLPSTYLSKIATSSNESKISATADATAGNSTYTFNKVDRLASAATNASESKITATGKKLDAKASIYSMQDIFAGAASNFDWKTTDGYGVSEKVKVSSAGKNFSLAKLSGGNIEGLYTEARDAAGKLTTAATKIKVTNKDGSIEEFTITTSKDEAENLAQDKVFVNKETGQLTFGKELKAESSFDISYTYIQNDSFIASSDKTEYKLSNAGIASAEGIKRITVTTYQKNADGTIKKDANGKSIISSTKDYTNFVLDPVTGNYKKDDLEIDAKTGKLIFANAKDSGAKIEASYSYSYFEFNMQTYTSKEPTGVTETFKINGGDSFESVLSKISKSGLGVSAFYDEYADKVTITRTETGDYNADVYDANGTRTQNNEINFMNDPFLKNILQLHGRNEDGGEDAKFTINGLETFRKSNTFTVNGVTFTLKETFKDTDPSVKIGTKTDSETVFKNIKEFIDKYNETIDKINKKTGEERYRDFTPLTAEQREAMSEKEAELWEEKAKSGLLRRDQKLTSVLDKMRGDFYNKVDFEGDSDYKQLATIGITTTNLYNVNKGKLEINEDKLKEAINNDPDAVYKLFANDSENYSEKGIARRLRDSMTTAITSIEETAGNDIKTNSQFTIGKNLDDIEDRVTDFERRLKQVEDRYYKQFNAMEQAVQKMNQQSSYLMSQLGMAQQ